VAGVRPRDQRHAEVAEPFEQDRLDRGRLAAAGERAGDDPGHAVQIAGAAQLGEHPVDPVLLLVHVFEQQDPAAGRPGGAGADRRGEQGQVPAQGEAPGRPADQRHRVGVGDRRRFPGTHQCPEQGGERVVHGGARGGDHRAVQRRPAEPGRDGLQDRRHVRVAREHLRRQRGQAVPVQSGQGALGTVAAAGEHEPGDGRIGQGRPQVAGAQRVVAGQVAAQAAAVRGARVQHRFQAGEPQDVQADAQLRLVHGAADGQDRHPVPGPQRRRPGQGSRPPRRAGLGKRRLSRGGVREHGGIVHLRTWAHAVTAAARDRRWRGRPGHRRTRRPTR